MRCSADERFLSILSCKHADNFLSGGVEDRRGFLLRWYRGPVAQPGLVARLQDQGITGVDIRRGSYDRVRLSIRNLQFVADQANLLPDEIGRLDAVAEFLKSVGDGTILVTGNTAWLVRAR
jgi:outer membrane protein OmpA-like peptidoglycan-associated protein